MEASLEKRQREAKKNVKKKKKTRESMHAYSRILVILRGTVSPTKTGRRFLQDIPFWGTYTAWRLRLNSPNAEGDNVVIGPE